MNCPPNQYPNCYGCGVCCILRNEKRLSVDDDWKIREHVYLKTGVIYIFPLGDFTLNLTKTEAIRMQRIGRERNIEISIKPKRIVYNETTDEIIVHNYYVDADVCPFVKNKLCSIYPDRPQVCSDFPLIRRDLEDFNTEIGTREKPTIPFADVVHLIQTRLKSIDIEIPLSATVL